MMYILLFRKQVTQKPSIQNCQSESGRLQVAVQHSKKNKKITPNLCRFQNQCENQGF